MNPLKQVLSNMTPGFRIEVIPAVVDEAFPPPVRLSAPEMERAILAGLSDQPMPEVGPEQDEQIEEFCQAHNLRYWRNVEKNRWVFERAKT